jgi:FKBP-type peptidyl-prolyl cis-trans isomerase FkpA
MKKHLCLLISFFLILSSCSKKDNFDATAQAATDDAAIQAYISSKSLTNVVKLSSGVYYQIITAGTGTSPIASSTITANYTGKYLDGTTFDSGTLNKVALSGLVSGWGYGLPYCKTGGRILLLIPSGLGYGHTPSNSINADAVLVFTIDLIGFT